MNILDLSECRACAKKEAIIEKNQAVLYDLSCPGYDGRLGFPPFP